MYVNEGGVPSCGFYYSTKKRAFNNKIKLSITHAHATKYYFHKATHFTSKG